VKINLIFIILILGEFFSLLFEQQNYFYLQNDDLEPFSISQLTIDKIISDKNHRYYLKDLYYSLDGQNIFKRVDRYRHKLFLMVIFSILIFINFHEILFNIIHLSKKIDPEYPKREENLDEYFVWNLISEFLCDCYILALLILSFYTFCKFGIDTKIYF
jgi:hypothetical protein